MSEPAPVRAHTVEFLRFGDPTGVLRLSDRYLRSIDASPIAEVAFPIPQERLERGLTALDYDNFARAVDAAHKDRILAVADRFIADLGGYLQDFVLGPLRPAAGRITQVDVVTPSLELAQLPFEFLEERLDELVVTRRVRQPWPLPPVVDDDSPKILYAWAAPKRRLGVPYEAHRTCLIDLLTRRGIDPEQALVEVGEATIQTIAAAFERHPRLTHVHILAHGIGPARAAPEPGEPIDLEAPPPPPTCLALGANDNLQRCSPEQLAALFQSLRARPASVTLASCGGAEIDPIRSGATLAHAVHAAGVPIVIASQLALTKPGSQELLSTFLAGYIDGVDPRLCLRDCRRRLREHLDQTYYDRVAVVGFVHLSADFQTRLQRRRLRRAFAGLALASRNAEDRLRTASAGLDPTGPDAMQHEAIESARHAFESIRADLTTYARTQSLGSALRAELRGLQASACKREAEAAWALSRCLSEPQRGHWLGHSQQMLRDAGAAYLDAARISRDHHWSWVQWLALQAVLHGDLRPWRLDWCTALSAARDATSVATDSTSIGLGIAWGHGSVCELQLLAPLAGEPQD
ncbi:MAG: CHAT domain-containing protein, partial [Gammaproteobacteria bacterium]|nr:CHAT domain-containing protein [Gammaproteobacteria bacterium]